VECGLDPLRSLVGGGESERGAGRCGRRDGQGGGGGRRQEAGDGRAVARRARLLPARQRVDDRVLDERAEHEDEAGRHPDVDRFRERAGRHAAQQAAALRRDRQDREDAQRGPRRRRLEVDPEGQPRQQDDEEARQVGGQDVRSQAPLQVEVGAQTREIACRQTAKRQFTLGIIIISARCNIYISSSCHDASPSVRLSVTEVHWRIIAKLGFKFRSHFTAHCGRRAAAAAVLLAGAVLLAVLLAGESSRAMLASIVMIYYAPRQQQKQIHAVNTMLHYSRKISISAASAAFA